MATIAESLTAKIDLDSTRFDAGISKVTRRLRGVGDGIARMGSIATKTLFGTLVAGGTIAFREAARFETAMHEVWTITDVSKEKLDEMGRSVIDLSSALGEDAATMARALYQTISAGVTDTAEATKLLGVAGKAAKAGLTDTFTAVDALTTVINSYGMATEDAQHISDVMFKTVELGKTRFEELGATVGRVTPIASQIGLQFEDISAAIATLTKGGLATDMAVTSLRQTMISVLKPTESAAKLAESLGLDFSAAALASKGLVGFLQDVAKATEGDSEVMAELFPNVRALAGVMSLAGTQMEEFTRIQQEMQDVTGASAVAFEKMMEAPAMKLQRLWIRFKNILIEIGKPILEAVIPAFEALSDWLETEGMPVIREFMGEWSENMKAITESVKEKGFLGALQEMVEHAMDLLKEVSGPIVTGLTEMGTTIIENLKVVVMRVIDEMWADLSQKMEQTWQQVQAAVDRIGDHAHLHSAVGI